MTKQRLLNTRVNSIDMEEAISSIEEMIQSGKRSYVTPINVDVVVKIEQDQYLKRIVDEADLVLVDGQPLVWISKLYRRQVKAKVSGSDLVEKLCEVAADKGYTLFILGGTEGVAEKAKKQLEEKWNGLTIVGTYSPPIGFENDQEELERINGIISMQQPDLLIVCLGCPKQEKFVYENIRLYDAKVSICAGATVDFLAQKVKRAPKWMSNHGLEWLFRVTQDPKRLFKRYFVDDMKIIWLMWKYRIEKNDNRDNED